MCSTEVDFCYGRALLEVLLSKKPLINYGQVFLTASFSQDPESNEGNLAT
jgi:hypothetical protein